MAIITGTPNQGNINVTLTGVSTPDIQNINLASANTEVSINLPANSQRFRISVRGSSLLKLAYNSGESGTTYLSIWPGSYYEEKNIDVSSLTLYVQSTQAGETVEVVSWV